MLDLSGSNLSLWSSQIGGSNIHAAEPEDVLYPVTALTTQVFYRNEHYRRAGVWLGASGIFCEDPRYTSDASMPHAAQTYGCQQTLDLKAGLARTSGHFFLGSQAGWEAGLHPERDIPFDTTVLFLKDSSQLGIQISSGPDTEIMFVPDLILEEHFEMNISGRGIARIGCDSINRRLQFQKQVLSQHAEGDAITYQVQPVGGEPYTVKVSAKGSKIATFNERQALTGIGEMFIQIQILSPSASPNSEARWMSFEKMAAEQAVRWRNFWSTSSIALPASEALWQQRYHTSLYYVAQSMGYGPTHPGGLSKPMFPYWRGCFHDTDTYFCRPLLDTGHMKEAAQHIAFRHRTLPAAREVARSIGRSGALYPWQTDMNGSGDTLEVPVNSAIIACEAWHQFLYSGDGTTLDQAYDILAETLTNLADHFDVSEPKLRFLPKPLMTFSETMVAEDPIEARIACRAVASAFLDALRLGGRSSVDLATLAGRILDELIVPILPDGSYAIGSSCDPEYLRCPSVTLGSFPLHELKASPELERTFDKELSKILLLFAWLPHQASAVASQLCRESGPSGATQLLRQADLFYKPWHAFDEWENRRSVRAAVFVTAAGGFCLAIHHVLIAETEKNLWRLFAGAPTDWLDVSFTDLYTRAGWKVSSRREGGQVTLIHAFPVHNHALETLNLEVENLHPSLQITGQTVGSITRLSIHQASPLRLQTNPIQSSPDKPL